MDDEISHALSILRGLNADITPHAVWTILDLQGIADDIPYEEIKARAMQCAFAGVEQKTSTTWGLCTRNGSAGGRR